MRALQEKQAPVPRRARRPKARLVRRLIVAVAVAATLTGGGIALVRSPLFQVDGIDVRGMHLLHRDEVLTASGLRMGMNVLSIDAAAVRARLEHLPLVARAVVERIYPSKVRISLIERIAAAAAQLPDGLWLIDGQGHMIASLPSVPQGLAVVRVSAVPGSAAMGEAMRLWGALPQWARRKTTDLAATNPSLISARLGGTQVIFGSADELIAKMQAVVAVFDRAKADGRRVVRIDVRAPRRPAAVFA